MLNDAQARSVTDTDQERSWEATTRARAPAWLDQERMLAAGLVILDILALLVAFGLASLARFANPWFPYHFPFSLTFYVRLISLVIPVYVVIFALQRLYDPHALFGGTVEYARVIVGCTFGVVAVVMYGFFDRDADTVVSRGWLLAAWLLTILVVGAARFGYRRVVYALRWK